MVAAPEVFGLWTELRVGLGDHFRLGLSAEFFDVVSVRGFFGFLHRYEGQTYFGSLTGAALSAVVWSPRPVRVKLVGEAANYCIDPSDYISPSSRRYSPTGGSGSLYGVGGAIELALSTNWALELEVTGRRYDGTIEADVWVDQAEESHYDDIILDDDVWTTVVGLSIRARLL